MKEVTKIVLNKEQTKKFLSVFIPEAIELAKKRLSDQEVEVCKGEESDS
ncbi:hypothetical protein [Brevibacillus porteri]